MITYFLFLDFEATCDDPVPIMNEIIEFPMILVKFENNKFTEIDRFHQYLTAPPTKVGGFYLIQLFDSYFWFHFFDLSFFRSLFLLILFA